MIKIVFFGTPDYVVPIVDKVNKHFRNAREKGLVAVVTQSPKPSGRGNNIEYSEVDHWAHNHNTKKIYDLDEVPEADLGIVASYGNLIPKNVIGKFKYGILNIHPSLLPKFRGASPVQATIISGNANTGLTIIKMDEKLDHGPIVSTFKDSVTKNDTAESLRNRLFDRSADFLLELIPNYVEGKIKPKEQNHDEATFTSQINKSDAYIDSLYLNKALNGEEIEKKISVQFIKDSSFLPDASFYDLFIRAMIPWPVAWTNITVNKEQKRIKILKAHVETKKLILDEVQLEGKSPVSYKQFLEGYSGAEFK